MNQDNVPRHRPPQLPQWNIPGAETTAPRPGSQNTTNVLSATWNSLLRLIVVIVLVSALLIPEVQLNASFRLVIIALLLVLIGLTSAAPLLIVFQALLFFRHSHEARWADVPGSCLFVVIVMGLVMFLSRDRTLKWIVRQSVTDLWKTAFTKQTRPHRPSGGGLLDYALPGERTKTTDQNLAGEVHRRSTLSTRTFPTSQDPQGSFLRLIMLQVVCVAIAQCLLLMFPLREADFDASGQAVTDMPTLLATIQFPLIALVGMVVVTSELAWRRITAQQASVYLRSTVMTLLYQDLRMIVLRKRKLRHRRTTQEPELVEDVSPVPETIRDSIITIR